MPEFLELSVGETSVLVEVSDVPDEIRAAGGLDSVLRPAVATAVAVARAADSQDLHAPLEVAFGIGVNRDGAAVLRDPSGQSLLRFTVRWEPTRSDPAAAPDPTRPFSAAP